MPDITIVPIAIKNTGVIDNNEKFNKQLGVEATFTMLPDFKIRPEAIEGDLEKIRQAIIQEIEG